MFVKSLVAAFTGLSAAAAQSCGPKPSGSIQPSVASGYQMQVVATGLASPRGITFDRSGNLLVVEKGRGSVSAHQISYQNGCASVTNSRNVTGNMTLNHGIEVSPDGRTLYVSSTEAAYALDYDAMNLSSSNPKTLVTNMTTEDHTTRTLLLSRMSPGMLLISRGSTSNIDFEATMLSSGHSTVKAFNISAGNGTAYNYDLDGLLMGWGLRNEVGIAEHPLSGLVYGAENSADQLNRSGIDIHEDNPAEKLNLLGRVNETSGSPESRFYGYPWCFAAWRPASLPGNGNLSVGSQFAIEASADSNGQNKTDDFCASATRAPRLVFQAHMAPLDLKFNASGREAWVPFHGSWNRDDPSGYKLAVVAFNDDGSPVDPSNSTTAATTVFANMDNSKCPDDCFRPVSVAFDAQGRAFMSSDATGEIYMIEKVAGANGTSNAGGSGGSGGSGGNSGATGSQGSGGSGGSGTNGGTVNLPSLGALAICFVLALAVYALS